jgi:zinc transport system substrate-binding protein
MNKKYILSGAVVVALLAGSFWAMEKYGRSVEIPTKNKLQVAASFYPLCFFSQQIGGDKADILDVTPSGAEPHDYEPTSRDMARMENSKLVILNGSGLEAWGSDFEKNIDTRRTLVVVASDGLADRQLDKDGKMAIDPHVWLSPASAEKMVDRILRGFEQADPENKDYYQANAAVIKLKIADLDAAYKQGLADCVQKNIVISHAAFGYLAAAYGFNQVAIAGLSPDAEPSPRQMADIVKFAEDNNVKYIFFESLVSPKLSETIAQEAGAKTLVLDPIEGLRPQDAAQGKDYFTQMHSNLANLQLALQCKK